MYDTEKHQILTFDKLKTATVFKILKMWLEYLQTNEL